MDTQLLTPSEIDSRLRYPSGRSVKLARKGLIPSVVLPDGEIRFDPEVIDRWLRDRATNVPTGREFEAKSEDLGKRLHQAQQRLVKAGGARDRLAVDFPESEIAQATLAESRQAELKNTRQCLARQLAGVEKEIREAGHRTAGSTGNATRSADELAASRLIAAQTINRDQLAKELEGIDATITSAK